MQRYKLVEVVRYLQAFDILIVKAKDQVTGKIMIIRFDFSDPENAIRYANLIKDLNICEFAACPWTIIEIKGKGYISVRPYIEGETLEALISDKTISKSMLYDTFRKLVAIVKKMHKHGLVHRDLHPGNIIVDEQGNVHIIDLEAACQTGQGDCSWTFTTKINPPDIAAYGASSLVKNNKQKAKLMKSIDIYDLGVMAWAIKNRSIPFVLNLHESFQPKVGNKTKIDKFIRAATQTRYQDRRLLSF